MAIILGGLSAFGALSIDMYLPAFPEIANEFHASPSLVQMSLTLFLIGMCVGQLFMGPLSDMIGRRKPLLIGLLSYGIVSLLCIWSPSIGMFVLLRFFQGLTASAGLVISRAVVRDLYVGTELTRFFSLLSLINGLAPIIAPIMGAQLLGFAPWQGVFIVLSIIGLAMFGIVVWGLPDTLTLENRAVSGVRPALLSYSRILRDRTFMGYALCQGLVFASMFAYISGSSFMVQNIYHGTATTFSIIFAVNGVGIMIASQITGKLAGRFSERSLFKAGIIMSASGGGVLLVAFLNQAPLYVILVPLFFIVSSVGVVATAGFSLAMENQGKSAGSAAAVLGVISLTLGGLVAPFVGIAGEYTVVPLGIITTICGICSLSCYYFFVGTTSTLRKGNSY
ncbi:DHA1 family bicyclomycin/chloramphenicol resistance-like MFS transporter [Croceifilum oryzae]|uniref:Bcr/CflA family efflux transporter n=1 Tax=Croceifilum oryzae TaxID=1553429 RepID=A0AAJ1WSL2_9BACL|nr:multidrug effflux MFS transporter [Croceifilum oryzae]MDQ0417103.1 DHA1 family bicyclomycin/chloramphenicol resistance-like MFS transporter [Croceifilum oryzae]